MSRVCVVTDSTSYLPEELTRKYGITVMPLSIIWDGQSYRDGIDIQPAGFYRRLQGSRTLPTTSQVTAAAFEAAFCSLLEQGRDVLGVFLSSQFSGTYAAALQASQAIPDAAGRIAIVDSGLTTVAMALPVLAAARAACAGEGLHACRSLVEQAAAHSGVLFVVETLEFLRRGGRIGGAQALLGTALNIKPVLAMREGRIEPLERVRRKSAAVERMLEIVVERVGGRQPVHIATAHADCEDEAAALLEAAAARLDPVEAFSRPLSPVIGAHVGPGTIALSYMTGGA